MNKDTQHRLGYRQVATKHQAIIVREPSLTQFLDLYLYHQVAMIQIKMSMSTRDSFVILWMGFKSPLHKWACNGNV